MISRRGFLGASIAGLFVGRTGADAPAAPEPVYSPWDSVRFASVEATAAKAAGGRKARYRRYLSLYNVPKKERKSVWAACSFLLNSLSREKRISRPSFLPDSDETVIALQLDDYAIDPDVWDKLATNGSGPAEEASPEPYFAWVATVERKVPVKRKRKTTYYQGRTWVWYEGDWHLDVPEEYTEYDIVPKRELLPAPWLQPDGGAAIAALQEATYTDYPILRADWFLTFAALPPLYFDFLGLGKKEADFQELVGADLKTAEKRLSQTKGVVAFSSVATHIRSLTRTPTAIRQFGGYYWVSHDSLKSTDERDYAAVLVNEEFDATEQIGSLPNGLQAYFLTDGKGNRLDAANVRIASDKESGFRSPEILDGEGCMGCHAKGIRPIKDRVRKLSDVRKKLALLALSDDPRERQKAKEVDALYFDNDLETAVAFDQAVFAAAVKACNDLPAAQNGASYIDIVRFYRDGEILHETMARDAGCTKEELLAVLKRAVGADHTLVGQLVDEPARRDQFERAFGQLQSLLGAARKEKK